MNNINPYFIYIKQEVRSLRICSNTTLSQQKLQHSLFLATVCTHLGAEQSSCSTIQRKVVSFLSHRGLQLLSSPSSAVYTHIWYVSFHHVSAGERPGRQSHALVIDTLQQSLTWKVSPEYTPCLSSHQFHQQAVELGAGKSKTGFSSLV